MLPVTSLMLEHVNIRLVAMASGSVKYLQYAAWWSQLVNGMFCDVLETLRCLLRYFASVRTKEIGLNKHQKKY